MAHLLTNGSGKLRWRRLAIAALLLTGLVALACGGGGGAPAGAIHVSTVDGDINPVTADFIDRALDRAEEDNATLWVLLLDTPGGLVSATDDIVQRFEAADVPIAVYVSPLGARAASAGTFITMAGHIASMAPSTQIGAATPIGGGGEDLDGDLGAKVENDAAADIRGIAELRGRNADWAESAVRDAVSATATEALDLNVIDLIANNLNDLLEQIDERVVELGPGRPSVTIKTAGAPHAETNMSFFEDVLDFISDPNIAFLLLSLGGMALLIEVVTGFGSGGAVAAFGVIALILAFFSLGTLDSNPAGITLVVLAFVLFLAEVFIAGFGSFGVGGVISLILGGLFLVSNTGPDAERVSIWVVVGVVAVIALSFLWFYLLVLAARRKHKDQPSLTERVVGQEGITQSVIAPEGTVLVSSELWTARSSTAAIPAQTRVRVIGVEELCLIIEPTKEAAPEAPAAVALIGRNGVARSDIDPTGTVFVHSELWTARRRGGAIPARTRIRVVASEGLHLIVEPLDEICPAEPPAQPEEPRPE